MSVSRELPAKNGKLSSIAADVYNYVTLMKPRVMSLVVFTALVGLILSPNVMSPLHGFLAILCVALGGGGAGALNMWYEADIDAVMKRTQKRPIPTGKISRRKAFIFGLALSMFSVLIMGIFINWFTAFFLSFTIFFYVVIYTIWLKRVTSQNIVIGGAAGAFPPMIGWAAATGTVSFESFLLFLIIFMWTPPHFWSLSLFSSFDYDAAGIPMMPNVRGEQSTKNQILIYAIIMAICAIGPYIIDFAGIIYGIFSTILSTIFIYFSYRLWKAKKNDETVVMAKKVFFFSLFYLSAIFGTLLLESIIGRFIIL
ncbi:protoheme IX farnesyltransferase [Bartonella clarridgeiae 73]|uniref:Protoheme IX farnesyltransferase n=1 Tax=Bartonella clarridgeiae (strain CCUG 45776 / CIP 104772 / 73) TaxID=696125 RepID=E6YGX9_BARC7|nr:heme o synthase [Bartonella clarridgeiae]WCR55297.1 MAG: Heme O synthase protoheme IX farnesyltransferase COX10-CtaB [Bartonella clarridgeiae]CBI76117.1 protoheme IX farnesyltransferase [Bartonella clarridgeiae 73]